MLLLTEVTLFFCNLLLSHTSDNESRNNLLSKVQNWAVSVDGPSMSSQTHSRGPSAVGSHASSHPRPLPSSLLIGTTAASSKNVSVNSEPTNLGRQGVPNKELVGGFGNDDLDDSEERAALARISSTTGRGRPGREAVNFLFRFWASIYNSLLIVCISHLKQCTSGQRT